MKPTDDPTLDCYLGVDFAGLFNAEDPNDPGCARSRAGYTMPLGNIRVLWASKMQTGTALSTMDAECIALYVCELASL
jgi:hypothetical protein